MKKSPPEWDKDGTQAPPALKPAPMREDPPGMDQDKDASVAENLAIWHEIVNRDLGVIAVEIPAIQSGNALIPTVPDAAREITGMAPARDQLPGII